MNFGFSAEQEELRDQVRRLLNDTCPPARLRAGMASAAPFDRDPSQLVYPPTAAFQVTRFADASARFDRCTFAAVWLIDFPPAPTPARDLRLAWRDDASAIYRVDPSACLSSGRQRR